MDASKLVVLGMGGTIAGRAAKTADHVGYVAGEVPVGELLAGLPVPEGVQVICEQVAQLDSKDMGPAAWRALLKRVDACLADPLVKGIVITHGTDTLEETAYLLQAVLAPLKPVVLTCAMRPSTALVPDGPQNLVDAMRVASEPGARGVVAVCAGQVHAARLVQKVHTYRTDAFSSGDAGPLGVVEAGQLTMWQPWPAEATPTPDLLKRLLAAEVWPRVEWITSHAGADGLLVRALLAQSREGGVPPLRGLVVAGTGNGTLHQDLEAALMQAEAEGVVVWRTSRCAQGRVLVSEQARLPVAPEQLPPAKARLALQLRLLQAC